MSHIPILSKIQYRNQNLMAKKITIVDYGLGNLFSVRHSFNCLGVETIISSDPNEIRNAEALVLPGVGAFGAAMKTLNETGLTQALREFIMGGKPFLGVCLGLQLLFEKSEEFGNTDGLGIIKGTIRKFTHNDQNGKPVRVPQIGWNRILTPDGTSEWQESPLTGLRSGEYMYFVHSYYASPNDSQDVLTETEYEGFRYCSAIQNQNVFAVQFHPEKSAKEGLKIYNNWSQKI